MPVTIIPMHFLTPVFTFTVPPYVDRGVTGNFEVTAQTDAGNVVLHSKKTGAGRCESPAERTALFQKLRDMGVGK